MKKSLLKGILLLNMLLIAGCSNKAATDDNELKTVNIAISNEGKADVLDATSYDSAMALYGAVYEPLVQYDGKGKYKSGLAETWEISEDGKTYTFHLKEGNKFSDGSDVNAEAVKFTIERAKYMNESTTLQTLTNLDKLTVIDDYTIEFSFTEVSNQVLAELCQTRPLRIMSPNSVDTKKYDGKFKQAIGSGAFVVASSSDEQTKMTPNSYYNGEQPVKYNVNFQTIQDGSSRFLAVKSGEIDIAGGTLGDVSDSDLATLDGEDKYKTYTFTGTMTHFMAFNPENTQLSAAVREGIDTAIDKKELSDQNLVGLFRDNVQYVTEDNQKETTYDVSKAKEIFEKEGYKLNSSGYYEKDGTTLTFSLVIQTTEFPEWKEKAEIIEQQLKQAGVKVSIQLVDKESYYNILWETKKYDLIFYRSYTDALLPYYFLDSLYANHDGSSGVLANDETLTNLLMDYAKMSDEEQQQEIFNTIFARISDQTLAVPIEYKDEKFVTSDKIAEFNYSGLSDAPIDFKALKVE